MIIFLFLFETTYLLLFLLFLIFLCLFPNNDAADDN